MGLGFYADFPGWWSKSCLELPGLGTAWLLGRAEQSFVLPGLDSAERVSVITPGYFFSSFQGCLNTTQPRGSQYSR